MDFDYDFSNKDPFVPLQGSIITGLLAGVIGGPMLVFGWEKWLRSQPYGVALRNITLSYIVVFLAVTIPLSTFFAMNWEGHSITEMALWQEVFQSLTRPIMLVPFFFWMIVVALTMITFLIDDKYGPGVFAKFLMGKYFEPSREERAFMFLDLRSSTTFAEQLGEENYFNFLRDAFRIITPAFIKHKAEIYQYVGDEIVLSWPIQEDFDYNQCINCFFETKKLLSRESEYFKSKYGILPEFKAGIHFGPVMAGEIGVIKREIAYSGDVLNTTARIQSKCNDHGVDLLISKALKDHLSLVGIIASSIGNINLKGKAKEMELYAVVQN